ncbi:hypothetical protein U9M48_041615 [Paspalum notatum var. saurae]|uniref:F-box domain-containing protein n=1 Tax=Paspalum notatum var. saurae TaxID=547442 RepID=A0AAQ3UP55_PASNO
MIGETKEIKIRADEGKTDSFGEKKKRNGSRPQPAGGGARPAILFRQAGMDRPKTKRSAAASAFPSLPDDATVEILSRVPAKSLCRFKCVSKGWRDLISERLRCKKLPQTLEGFFYADDEVHGGNSDGGHGKEEACVDIQWRFINTLGRSVPLVDSSFNFLFKQLPCTESIGLLQSCNGLLLFGHKWGSDMYDSLGYIVCNPATEQWMSVPSSGWTPFLDKSEDEDSDSESAGTRQELIVAVDVKGRKCRTMSWPENRGDAVFLDQSQGCLHYITEQTDKGREITELCIWVLQDYDAEEWVLKHRGDN